MYIFSADILSSLSERLEKVAELLRYSFVTRALAVAVLIAICAALVGVFLVLKKYSSLSDGLSHAAFGAAAIAAAFGVFDLGITLPLTIIAAVLILKGGRERRIMGDAAIAMVSVGALAIGYTVMSLRGGAANLGGDVCSALFGSAAILAIESWELISVAVMTLLLVALVIIFRHRLLFVTYDDRVADATGTRVGIYETAIAIVTAVVIVVGMKLAGALLISALAVFPALTAMRICKSFSRVLIFSALIGAVCAAIGVILSIFIDTPIGATVAAVDMVTYGIVSLFKRKR